MKQAGLVLVVMLALGCGQTTDAPKIAEPELSDEDVAVLRVALDAALGAEYGRADAETAARLVTPDRTVRVCEPPQRLPFTYDCMWPKDFEAVNRDIAELFGQNALTIFRERNRTASRLGGSVDGLRVVPSETLFNLLHQPGWLPKLTAQFPGKDGVVIFTAPAYPTNGQATVYVLHVASAAFVVHLQDEGQGWKVKAVRGLWVS